MVAQRRKPEDTADGCRALAQADRDRAAEMANVQMRGTLERSAENWNNRANLLERIEGGVTARAAANAQSDEMRDEPRDERNDDGQGTGPIEQGEAQAEGELRQGQERARPRIKGLSNIPLRKDGDAH
ncbi:MAG: hypothetical protein ACJ8EI_10240 [Sphingomicrobium sp.]